MWKRLLPALLAVLVLLAPDGASALLDLPTRDRRALSVADLASSSGVARPLDLAAMPFDDAQYLEAYRKLEPLGLVDTLGARIEAMAKARSDGALHLEYLRPRIDLRAFHLGSDTPRRVLYHSGGDVLREGLNGFQSASGAAFWGERIGGEYEIQFQEADSDLLYRTKRLYAKGVLGKWSLKVGRDSERLGPGYHGGLLLDDDIPTLDLWRIRTEEPLFLPGKLARIGGFRFLFLSAYLADPHPTPADPRYATAQNPVKDPGLLAMRFSYSPAAWFELGFNRTELYGGKGRKSYGSPKDWWKLLGGMGEHTVSDGTVESSDNDNIVSFDLTLSLPFLNGLGPLRAGKLYWEHASEDPSFADRAVAWGTNRLLWVLPVNFGHSGYLAGVYLSTAVTDLRIEYARTDPAWYVHPAYPQGYTYRGISIGHHMGPDATDYYFEVSRYFGPRWRAVLGVDLEERGRHQPGSEKRKEGTLTVEVYDLRLFGYPARGALDALAGRVTNPWDDPERRNRTEYYLGAGVNFDL